MANLIGAPDNVNDFARTNNCDVLDEPAAEGVCSKNTFGDWHCGMGDTRAMVAGSRQHVLPPEKN